MNGVIEVFDSKFLCFGLLSKLLHNHIVNKPKSSFGMVRHLVTTLHLYVPGGMVKMYCYTSAALLFTRECEVNEPVDFRTILIDSFNDVTDGDDNS